MRDVKVDGPSHAAAVRKTLDSVATADELIDILTDVLTFRGEHTTIARFPFGTSDGIEVDRSCDWVHDVIRAFILAAKDRRRGRSRVMPRPPVPLMGRMFRDPSGGLLCVLCSTASGITFAVPLVDGRWKFELLQAFAAETFQSMEPYPPPAEKSASRPPSDTLTPRGESHEIDEA